MATLPYTQDIEDCLTDGPAGGRLPRSALSAVLADAAKLPELLLSPDVLDLAALLALPGRSDDLDVLRVVAADWRSRFDRVVLFGVGGSSLGARALAPLARNDTLELVVPDNLDVGSMAAVLCHARDPRTGYLVISKSGGTAETMVQALTAIDAVQSAGMAPGERFLAVTEPGDNPLRRLAADLDIPIIDHDPHVGGRFSVLSVVGMLPALLLDLDADAIRAGAGEVLEQAASANDPGDIPALLGAALNVALMRRGDVRQSVLMAYGDRFQPFCLWYRQIWAESLGKGGHGSTPVDALGPVDQHSQLQLYLDGPADKLYTVLTADLCGQGPRVPAATARACGLDYLADVAVGDLVAVMQRATGDAIAARGRPVRRLAIGEFDERSLGALFMHFILETVFAGHLLGVDPFGQPAVEEGKVLARRYLAEAP
jgi:glucose-6-phosphate isomerase